MKKPVEAIERMRKWGIGGIDKDELCAYLDSIPEDAHVCKWPEGLTRECLADLAAVCARSNLHGAASDFLALAAIAPEKPKKRMAQAYMHVSGQKLWVYINDAGYALDLESRGGWRKVGGPFEVDA